MARAPTAYPPTPACVVRHLYMGHVCTMHLRDASGLAGLCYEAGFSLQPERVRYRIPAALGIP